MNRREGVCTVVTLVSLPSLSTRDGVRSTPSLSKRVL